MKASKFIHNMFFLFLPCCVFPGCITMYKPMHLNYTPLDIGHMIGGVDVQIGISYDVLSGPGTRQYAKMQRKNKVSLVMLTIQNLGQQDLYVDRDLIFQTSTGDTILPLTLEHAGESFVKPVNNEENTAFFQVEPPSGWISDVGKLVNDSKKVVSHIRFTGDMYEYYLEGRIVAPGSYERGLFVFPVVKGTVLHSTLR